MLLSPLSDPIALPHTCAPHCTTQIAAPLQPSRHVVSFEETDESPSTSLALPNCTGPDPIAGSFIPAHPLDVLYPPETLPQPFDQPVVGRYNFVPESCVWRHAGLRFRNPKRCTENPAKVFITGDSHGRVAYDSLVHRLKGNTDILLESVSYSLQLTTTVSLTEIK